MKTVTITLSDEESGILDGVAAALDPSASISRTTVAKMAVLEGLIRQAKRFDVELPLPWLTTESLKRYLSAVRS